MRHFESSKLWLTPLTPIHIRCGEDFEPTNYVIDEEALYWFDPSRVPLSMEDRGKLLQAVGTGGADAISRLQRFFFERRDTFSAFASRAIAVAPGIGLQYTSRIGQVAQHEIGGRRVRNSLEIERTTYHPHTGTPYIPGSSIKGAVRTAWLSAVNASQPARKGEKPDSLERRLLEGAFQTDPFRLVRIADAAGAELVSKVMFSTNHKKRVVHDKEGRPRQAQGPATRKETVAGGQYRALAAELRIDGLGGKIDREKTPSAASRVQDARALAVACNAFYVKLLVDELGLLVRRGLVASVWADGLRALIEGARPAFERGAAMLLRVGRHSGAESVTIDGVRSIRIKKKTGEPAGFESSATTVWLAAEREDANSGMLPFGWLLVEVADGTEIPGLQAWCDTQPKPDLAEVRQKHRLAREKAEAGVAREQRIAEDKRTRAEAETRASEERVRRLAELSEQGRMVELLRERLERHTAGKQPVSGVLYAESRTLMKAALQGTWTQPDKQALAELVATLGFQKIDFGGKEKEVKRELRSLRGDA